MATDEYNFCKYVDIMNSSTILEPDFIQILRKMYISILIKINSKIKEKITELGQQMLFLTSFVILSKYENERIVNITTLKNFSPATFEVTNLTSRILELELMILKYINFDVEKFK